MTLKKLLGFLQVLLPDEDIFHIALDKGTATFAPNFKADIIAHNRPHSGTNDHKCNIQAVVDSGVKGAKQEHCLPRNGNPDTLNHDKEEDHRVAEGGQQLLQGLK